MTDRLFKYCPNCRSTNLAKGEDSQDLDTWFCFDCWAITQIEGDGYSCSWPDGWKCQHYDWPSVV